MECEPEHNEGDIDGGWLGSYNFANAAITLYVGGITRVAAVIGCSTRRLGRIVLKHELGHHAAPGTDEERSRYVSCSTNEATCRAETAAQLFAWYTSDAADRNVMLQRLDRYLSEAYRMYQELLRCSQAVSSPDGDVRAEGIRLGWINAWQLVQAADRASLMVFRQRAAEELAGLSTVFSALIDASGSRFPSVEHWSILSTASKGVPCLARKRPGQGISLFANGKGKGNMRLLLHVPSNSQGDGYLAWRNHHCVHMPLNLVATVDRSSSRGHSMLVNFRVFDCSSDASDIDEFMKELAG